MLLRTHHAHRQLVGHLGGDAPHVTARGTPHDVGLHRMRLVVLYGRARSLVGNFMILLLPLLHLPRVVHGLHLRIILPPGVLVLVLELGLQLAAERNLAVSFLIILCFFNGILKYSFGVNGFLII